MKHFLCFLLVALVTLTGRCRAQFIERESFIALDSAIARLGPMPDSSLKAISGSLIRLCHGQAEVVHAFYYWTANNVAFDCPAWHRPNMQNNSASRVLRDRKATAAGYAEFFRQLCSIAYIPCTTVNGWAKSFPSDIGRLGRRQRHSWNIVSIDGRQYVMDLTWAAGGTDERVRRFTKQYSDAWYGTNRRLFALCHHPDDKRHQLLDTPVTKSVCAQAPIIGPAAVGLDIFPEAGVRGKLRGRGADSTVTVRFWVKKPEKIRSLAIYTEGGRPQPVPFELTGNDLTARLPLGTSKQYDAYLIVNNGVAFGYQVTGRKRKGGG